MKIIVAGATGETGRRIVQELVNRQIAVRALVRDEAIAKTILPSGPEIVVGDVLKPDSLQQALRDCTVVICATGAKPSFDPTGPYKVDFEGTKNLVNAAKQQGIEHFVLVTSLCTSQFFHPLNLFWLILVWKQQAEQYLKNSGLTYTIVRPGGLKNEDDDRGVLIRPADTLFDGSIPRTKVAQVCVEALFQPNARNQILEIIAQPELAARTISEAFEQLTPLAVER
jgi:uncharacterized protein YbjT (DUF2867 family)